MYNEYKVVREVQKAWTVNTPSNKEPTELRQFLQSHNNGQDQSLKRTVITHTLQSRESINDTYTLHTQ